MVFQRCLQEQVKEAQFPMQGPLSSCFLSCKEVMTNERNVKNSLTFLVVDLSALQPSAQALL